LSLEGVTGQLRVLLLHFRREPWYTFNRRLGGFRASVDILVKRKISCLCWNVNFGSSIVYSSHYICNAIPALMFGHGWVKFQRVQFELHEGLQNW